MHSYYQNFLEKIVHDTIHTKPDIRILANAYPSVSDTTQDSIIHTFINNNFIFDVSMKQRLLEQPLSYWIPSELSAVQRCVAANRIHDLAVHFSDDFLSIEGYQELLKEVFSTIDIKEIPSFLRDIDLEKYVNNSEFSPAIYTLFTRWVKEVIDIYWTQGDPSDSRNLYNVLYYLHNVIEVIDTSCDITAKPTIVKKLMSHIFNIVHQYPEVMQGWILWNDGDVVINKMIGEIDNDLLAFFAEHYSMSLTAQYRVFDHLENKIPNISFPHTQDVVVLERLLRDINPYGRPIRIQFVDTYLLSFLKEDMTIKDACFFCRFFMGHYSKEKIPLIVDKLHHLERFGINIVHDILEPLYTIQDNKESHKEIFMPLAYRLYTSMPNHVLLETMSDNHPLNFGIHTGCRFDSQGTITSLQEKTSSTIESMRQMMLHWDNVVLKKPDFSEEIPLFC